ncbi:plasmid stabilization protein [Priestia aryabhattai]|uniref:plasmid stabilization protein n=1 Tax=Priestia aryabhattai TaxID=412384 RepID=UPI001FD75083|nr:plasmid stabilization protein [Priestia aryabhattai]
MYEKILIQGEPTLDISIDECPGEIGIICFQITVLPNKNDKETNESKDKKEAKQEASALSEAQKSSESAKQVEKQDPVSQPIAKEEQKAAPQKKQLPTQPKWPQDVVSFDEIIVPEAFLRTRPNPEKTQKVVDFVKRTGHLDKPLTIEKGSKVLKDGYRRYVVAKTVKMEKVPVVYNYQK